MHLAPISVQNTLAIHNATQSWVQCILTMTVCIVRLWPRDLDYDRIDPPFREMTPMVEGWIISVYVVITFNQWASTG